MILNCSPFLCLEAIFSLLRHMLKNSLDMNLSITDALSKLAHYPSKTLHAYLLTPAPQAGRHSLISILEEVCNDAVIQIKENPEYALGAERLLRSWTQSSHVDWYVRFDV